MKNFKITISITLMLLTNFGAVPIDEENFLSNPNIAPLDGEKNVAVNLYSPEDDVEVLTCDNFKAKVENSSRAWLVQFYSIWNKDCEEFAPTWKQFATDISNWKDLVPLGVVACSEEVNVPLCEEYKIAQHPVVKYFSENYVTVPEDLGAILYETADDTDTLRYRLIDKILEEIGEGKGVMYPSNLLPYTHADISQLYDLVPDTTMYAFLIVEPPESYLGLEMVLDFHKNDKITVIRALSNNSALINDLSIDKFPEVLIYGCCDNKPQKLGGEIGNRNQLRHAIVTFLIEKEIQTADDIFVEKNDTERS